MKAYIATDNLGDFDQAQKNQVVELMKSSLEDEGYTVEVGAATREQEEGPTEAVQSAWEEALAELGLKKWDE